MAQITVSLETSGLTTAEQLLSQLVSQRQDLVVARRQTVDAHTRDLADMDKNLALFDARIAELQAFVNFKRAGN